jgi:hypothetical protein
MSTVSKPKVIVIDDEPITQETTLRLALGEQVDLTVLAPDEVEVSHLKSPSLVLVDYHLDAWERPAFPISICPPNGVALAGILRQHANSASAGPMAFAVYSAYLPELSAPLPPERRQPLIARSHDLEWAFSKAQPGVAPEMLYRQINGLASAVSTLPQRWPGEGTAARDALARFLGLSGKESWFDDALKAVVACQPPLHELSTWSHGVAVIRWLLHRILPYPCFLFDRHYLARRLQSTPTSVAHALREGGRLAELLQPCEYGGALEGFLGQRWWQTGVDSILATLRDPMDAGASLIRELDIELESVVAEEPVVCLDEDYRLLDDLIDVSSAVRLQIDDWPDYATRPYARIESAREHQRLQNLVLPLDKGLLN